MQRPAEQLATSIANTRKRWQKTRGILVAIDGRRSALVSVRTLQRWERLAKRIDARMRLDGSPRSKQKKVKSDV